MHFSSCKDDYSVVCTTYHIAPAWTQQNSESRAPRRPYICMYVELMRGSPYHHHQRSTAMKLASCRPFLSPSALRRRPHNSPAPRTYVIQTAGAPMLQVFNNQTKYLQRERAASDPIASRKVDYLRDEIASRLCERLLVCYPPRPSL